jgi:cytochrome bd-type quinol oxidase subunit 2
MGCKILHQVTPKKQPKATKEIWRWFFYIGGIGHCFLFNVFLGLFLGGMHNDIYSSISTKFLGGIHSHHLYSKTFSSFFFDGIGSGFYSNIFPSFFYSWDR